jgi:DNA-binding response OmpR family regulator
MRPKKKILIVSASEERASILRFTLYVRGFDAAAVLSAEAATVAIREALYDLLLCDLPLVGVEQLLAKVHASDSGMRTVVLASRRSALPQGLYADAVMAAGYLPEDLVDRIKIMTARKRGPKPAAKPVDSVPVPVVYEAIRRLA